MIISLETTEADAGRWRCEAKGIPNASGPIMYAATPEEARRATKAAALRFIAARLSTGDLPDMNGIDFVYVAGRSAVP